MTVKSNERFRASKDFEACFSSFNKLKAFRSFYSHVRRKARCLRAVKCIEKRCNEEEFSSPANIEVLKTDLVSWPVGNFFKVVEFRYRVLGVLCNNRRTDVIQKRSWRHKSKRKEKKTLLEHKHVYLLRWPVWTETCSGYVIVIKKHSEKYCCDWWRPQKDYNNRRNRMQHSKIKIATVILLIKVLLHRTQPQFIALNCNKLRLRTVE
jgi:hypothetical protein